MKNNGCTKFKRIAQMICAILCITLMLGACVGCTSNASSEEVSALQTNLNNALTKIDSVNSENAAALQEIASLKSAQEAAKAELESLKSQCDSAKSALESLEAENKAAKEKLDALNNANAEAKQELDSAKQELDSAKQELDSAKQKFDEAKQELTLLNEKYQAAVEEIETLKEALASAEGEVDELNDSYAAAEQKIGRLKAQIEYLQYKISLNHPSEKIRIYIDQGHNPTSYHNAGAVGNGLYEQDLTYNIGILLAELLEEDGRFEICLSRPTEDTVLGTDNNSSLDARVEGAKAFGADYFISLHINSFTDSSVRGIEVYTAENSGSSYSFGSSLLAGMVESTGIRNRGMKVNSSLRVLKNAVMPAALLEMGFISNADDAAMLSQSPELFANGIYNGILSYFELEAK